MACKSTTLAMSPPRWTIISIYSEEDELAFEGEWSFYVCVLVMNFLATMDVWTEWIGLRALRTTANGTLAS